MIAQDKTVYYDRAFINQLYGLGFHLANDLVSLYPMKSYLKKHANFSLEARKRIKWMDYYHKRKNVFQIRMFLKSAVILTFPAKLSINGITAIIRKTYTPWKIKVKCLSRKEKEKLLLYRK